jgi:hypothetical protein
MLFLKKENMKKLFVAFILLVICAQKNFAQGNLQFNQVKYYELSVTQTVSGPYAETQQSITVPAGKVWKIESAFAGYYVPSNNSTGLFGGGRMFLDNRPIFDDYLGSGAAAVTSPLMPIWLPPGTYTLAIKSPTSSSSTTQYLGSVSIIEFNVIP